MIKKLILSVALIGVVAANCSSSFEGFHVAGGVGASQTGGKWNLSHQDIPLKGRLGSDNPNVDFSLVAGYTFAPAQDFLVGVELFANLHTGINKVFDGKSSLTAKSTFDVDMKKKYSLGGALRLGYQISPKTAAFLSLGLGTTRVEVMSKNVSTGQAAVAAKNVETKKNLLTFKPGVDIEHNFTKEVFVRLGLAFAMSRSITYDQIALDAGGFSGLDVSPATFNGMVRPTSMSATISVGYRF